MIEIAKFRFHKPVFYFANLVEFKLIVVGGTLHSMSESHCWKSHFDNQYFMELLRWLAHSQKSEQ